MTSELYLFVKHSLEKGIERTAIRNALLEAGWREDEVRNALSGFAQVSFPLPVPKPKPYLQAREAFLYLVSFIALYIFALSFGSLIFYFIEQWFPDVTQYMYFDVSFGRMRMAISALVVSFPLYLWLSLRLKKARSLDPDKRESKVRKWLTYGTLVVASAIIIGDFIGVLFNLLGGELTIRFFLKALTVFLITGSIFGYYLSDFKGEEKKQ